MPIYDKKFYDAQPAAGGFKGTYVGDARLPRPMFYVYPGYEHLVPAVRALPYLVLNLEQVLTQLTEHLKKRDDPNNQQHEMLSNAIALREAIVGNEPWPENFGKFMIE